MSLKRHLRLLVLTGVAVVAGIGLSGCDDHVTIDRDPSVPIRKGMTWAWRPASPQLSSDRRVVSRDAVTPNREYRRNSNWENDIVRNRITRAKSECQGTGPGQRSGERRFASGLSIRCAAAAGTCRDARLPRRAGLRLLRLLERLLWASGRGGPHCAVSRRHDRV